MILEQPFEVRNILADYLETSSKKGLIRTAADHNWSIAPINSKHDLDILFQTSNTKDAMSFIQKYQTHKVTPTNKDNEYGLGIYKIDLSK